ncbi:MAG: glycosyltransferase family 2 protein [Paracoccaceae bacterium]
MRAADLWARYKLVWKRRRLLWRAIRSRHVLNPVQNRTSLVSRDAILTFVCVRNEMSRLPHMLDHYRKLGVSHFLIVDNDSTDGTVSFLEKQPDVSLWQTSATYREARFGLDWMNWLLLRYGRGHWCLYVDADELLTFAHSDTVGLPELTRWLDERGQVAFGALMLDLYPARKLDEPPASENLMDHLQWFDAGPYRAQRQSPLNNLWVQGGVRERVFFADTPHASPTLNKLPLIRWHWRYVYVNSTHSALPRSLNMTYDGPSGTSPSGVLLHTKFQPEIIEKSVEDRVRQQHFHDPTKFAAYYDLIQNAPTLWNDQSVKYEDWQQLAELGLLNPADFKAF